MIIPSDYLPMFSLEGEKRDYIDRSRRGGGNSYLANRGGTRKKKLLGFRTRRGGPLGPPKIRHSTYHLLRRGGAVTADQ